MREAAAGLEADWADLVPRAEPNVFLHPGALNAVGETGFARLRLLLAWDRAVTPERLAGIWAFAERNLTPVGPAFLDAPVHDYAFVGSPIVDASLVETVVPALLAAIAADPSLPKLVRLKYLDGGATTTAAIRRAIDARGSQCFVLAERERPYVTRDAGRKQGGSTRKKLRQDWNRLTRLGALDVVNERTPGAVAEAFETFLALEAASWKGEAGTALLSRPEDAAMVRRMIGNLATAGSASVALMRLDGKAIAAQVLLYCGETAYTWKIAFDAEQAQFSPGAVLVDRLSDELLATEFTAIESCSPEGGFMTRMWDGRRPTVDLIANLSAGKSLSFGVAVAKERARAGLKDLRQRYRASKQTDKSAAA